MDSIDHYLDSRPVHPEGGLVAPGTMLGDWRVLALLGHGGSGEVYRVERARDGALAAAKVLSRDDDASRRRFERETSLFARNASVAFPRFHASGAVNGHPYYVMELLEPCEPPRTDRAVARYLLGICRGVSELHRHGLVHRDLKPQNVMQRADGTPVLIDLGLVKDTSVPFGAKGTSISVVDGRAVGLGTPGYAAPEQLVGGDISPAADIHALGVLANACFDGLPPRAWARIIRRATSSIPGQRYAGVGAFARAIRHRHDAAFALIGLALAALAVLAVARVFFARGTAADEQQAEASRAAVPVEDERVGTDAEIARIRGRFTPKHQAEAPRAAVPTENDRPTADPERVVTRFVNEADPEIRLGGRVATYSRPIELMAGQTLHVIGPGTLDAEIFGPTNSHLIATNCIILNSTRTMWPENGTYYHLLGHVYLNFTRLDDPGYGLPSLWDFQGGINDIRFRGPTTIRGLNLLRNAETRAQLDLERE